MTQLSLKFCFLHVEQIKALSQHLKVNKTLVYLDLKHNGLENESGQYISEMLAVNYHLHCVNLENNLLGDDFIIHLCQSLQKNNTLAILKLGYNSIGERGAKQIISLMGVGNDTIEDLGDIGNNPMGLGLAEQINQQLTKNNNMRKGSV
jgi:Ran GTPase-activating protein (RanGAP) involved in mRNA processing and transport